MAALLFQQQPSIHEKVSLISIFFTNFEKKWYTNLYDQIIFKLGLHLILNFITITLVTKKYSTIKKT